MSQNRNKKVEWRLESGSFSTDFHGLNCLHGSNSLQARKTLAIVSQGLKDSRSDHTLLPWSSRPARCCRGLKFFSTLCHTISGQMGFDYYYSSMLKTCKLGKSQVQNLVPARTLHCGVSVKMDPYLWLVYTISANVWGVLTDCTFALRVRDVTWAQLNKRSNRVVATFQKNTCKMPSLS